MGETNNSSRQNHTYHWNGTALNGNYGPGYERNIRIETIV